MYMIEWLFCLTATDNQHARQKISTGTRANHTLWLINRTSKHIDQLHRPGSAVMLPFTGKDGQKAERTLHAV